jgi:hypothetical protein
MSDTMRSFGSRGQGSGLYNAASGGLSMRDAWRPEMIEVIKTFRRQQNG